MTTYIYGIASIITIVGIYLLKHKSTPQLRDYFHISNMIDTDCNGDCLEMGVHGFKNPNNILSNQGIRIGNNNINCLISFSKSNNSLIYEFENDIQLVLIKNENNNDIIYSLKTPDRTIVKYINKDIWNIRRSIKMNSAEIDEIIHFN